MSLSRFGVAYPGDPSTPGLRALLSPGVRWDCGVSTRALCNISVTPAETPSEAAPCTITLEGTRRISAGTIEERQVMSTQGTVKWFNSEKGFGFIAPDEGGADVFAHYTAIAASGYRSLEENQRVEFEIAQGPKGLQAENIRPI
nr:hypothetical protein GCM10025699_08580 [Microbacterium flavescens]